jgi:hypothetical protein
MTINVTYRFNTSEVKASYDMLLSEYIYNAPEWGVDFDTIVKIEVM